jgi:rare lipoprotein A (peptidoglycan hydrolase)
MRPWKLVRPAAAGALGFAFTAVGAQAALSQTETSAPAPGAQAAVKPQIAVRHHKRNVRAGRHTAVSGTVAPNVAGLVVSLQVKRDHRWKRIDRIRTDSAGRYRLRARLGATGSYRARVALVASATTLPAKRRIGRVNVFRYAQASWYGPGLYGNALGCGGTLSTGRLGVAHKSLPCGTMVTFKHGKRSVRVPVIDRGPYVAGREYDLTAATAQRLGFSGHGAILTTR